MPSVTANTSFKVAALAVPQVSSVQVSGSGADAQITITGSNFGSPTHAMPYTGDLSNFQFTDNFSGWNAGHTGNAVTVKFTSWTDTQIVISGFAGSYGQGSYILQPGDTITVNVTNAQTGKTSGATTTLANPIAPLTSNTPLVLGTAPLSATNAYLLTGVKVSSLAQSNESDGPFTTSSQAQTAAQGLSSITGNPAFVWAERTPPYDGSKTLYLVTVGRTNPFGVAGFTGTDWGFDLQQGYVNGQQVSVRPSVITAAVNLYGESQSSFVGYKMAVSLYGPFKNIQQGKTDYGYNLGIRLYSGSQQISGNVTISVSTQSVSSTFSTSPANNSTNGNVTLVQTGYSDPKAPDTSTITIQWTDPSGGVHTYKTTFGALAGVPYNYSTISPIVFFG